MCWHELYIHGNERQVTWPPPHFSVRLLIEQLSGHVDPAPAEPPQPTSRGHPLTLGDQSGLQSPLGGSLSSELRKVTRRRCSGSGRVLMNSLVTGNSSNDWSLTENNQYLVLKAKMKQECCCSSAEPLTGPSGGEPAGAFHRKRRSNNRLKYRLMTCFKGYLKKGVGFNDWAVVLHHFRAKVSSLFCCFYTLLLLASLLKANKLL